MARQVAEKLYAPTPTGAVRILLPAMLLAALIAAALQWLAPLQLPIKRVQVPGTLSHVQPEILKAVVEPKVLNGFVQMDVETLRSEVEALPWVYRASVRRAWPDTVVVQIEEQQPLARWHRGGLLNVHGDHFTPLEAPWQGQLPVFRGPEGSELQLVEHFEEMKRMLKPLGLTIRTLALDERRAWRLELDNGWQLLLGRHQTYPRLLRFVRVYPVSLAPRMAEITQIDLRYTNGFAVRWREDDTA